MKINKVLFSCSVDYAPFWNIQSRVWKDCLGIEPVCLFFGDKVSAGMSEEFGKVIERTFIPELPQVLQVVWSKFDHPITEPDTTWIIGDIDLIPLQRAHFIDKLKPVPASAYAHLNAFGISSEPGRNLPAHYHVSLGRNFELFTQGRSLENQIRQIVAANKYGQGPKGQWTPHRKAQDETAYHWLAEEHYSSELIWQAIKDGKLDFHPITYNNQHGTERIDRSHMRKDGRYDFSWDLAFMKGYVDVHCARPYNPHTETLDELLDAAWPFYLC